MSAGYEDLQTVTEKNSIKCPFCKGTGKDPNIRSRACPVCYGRNRNLVSGLSHITTAKVRYLNPKTVSPTLLEHAVGRKKARQLLKKAGRL